MRSDKRVYKIQDCPEAEVLVKRLDAYRPNQDGPVAFSPTLSLGFTIGQSGDHLHFSREVLGSSCKPSSWPEPGLVWAAWQPTIANVRALVKVLTCPVEDLPRYAMREDDYNVVHLKFVGMTKVPSLKSLVKNIALARLAGKL